MRKFFIFLCILQPFELVAASFILKKIKIEDLTKTKPKVILNLLEINEGDLVTEEDIKAGIARIKNTQIFHSVRYELDESETGKTLTISAKDRWTTIPVFKFSSGGGVNQTIIGLYDPNIMGEYLELGGQLEKLGSANSNVVWFRNRRFLGYPLFLDLQSWDIRRLRTRYLLQPDSPETRSGFLHHQRRIYLGLQWDIFWLLKVGISLERDQDSFSKKYVSNKILDESIDKQLPPNTTFNHYGLNVEIGRINYDSFLTEGGLLRLDYSIGYSRKGDGENFQKRQLIAKYFATILDTHTFAQRFILGNTTAKNIQYHFYLGGLDRIRGFADNRFDGRSLWLSNTETRFVVYKNDLFIIHNSGFIDILGISEKKHQISSLTAASMGLGMRVTAPKIYRFVGRLDYAVPIVKKDSKRISFGVQQFF